MGGRGKDSGLRARQLTINDTLRQHTISDIIEKSAAQRAAMVGSGIGGGASLRLLKKCACCGEYTIPIGSMFEECSNCGWIDDEYQNNHPDSLDGKNTISLLQAKSIYHTKQSQHSEEVK
jgi:rRNA maturation protein Nop10